MRCQPRPGTAFISGSGRSHRENVIEPCRALHCRDPFDGLVVRHERHGGRANHAKLHPSRRHGHGTGAKGEAGTEAGASGKHRYGSPERTGLPGDGSSSGRGAAGSCDGEACPAREGGQQLQRWLRIQLPSRQGPLGRMQRVRGILFSFLGDLQRYPHPQGLRAMRGNQDVPGLGPKPILVVLHRYAEWGEISAHRRESKQVAHAGMALICGLGRTSYENITEPCRPLSCRCLVDRVAERHGSFANLNGHDQPASQHHRPGAEAGGEAGGKTTKAGSAGGQHGRSAPNRTGPSGAIDYYPKAGVRFSDGEDRCA